MMCSRVKWRSRKHGAARFAVWTSRTVSLVCVLFVWLWTLPMVEGMMWTWDAVGSDDTEVLGTRRHMAALDGDLLGMADWTLFGDPQNRESSLINASLGSHHKRRRRRHLLPSDAYAERLRDVADMLPDYGPGALKVVHEDISPVPVRQRRQARPELSFAVNTNLTTTSCLPLKHTSTTHSSSSSSATCSTPRSSTASSRRTTSSRSSSATASKKTTTPVPMPMPVPAPAQAPVPVPVPVPASSPMNARPPVRVSASTSTPAPSATCPTSSSKTKATTPLSTVTQSTALTTAVVVPPMTQPSVEQCSSTTTSTSPSPLVPSIPTVCPPLALPAAPLTSPPPPPKLCPEQKPPPASFNIMSSVLRLQTGNGADTLRVVPHVPAEWTEPPVTQSDNGLYFAEPLSGSAKTAINENRTLVGMMPGFQADSANRDSHSTKLNAPVQNGGAGMGLPDDKKIGQSVMRNLGDVVSSVYELVSSSTDGNTVSDTSMVLTQPSSPRTPARGDPDDFSFMDPEESNDVLDKWKRRRVVRGGNRGRRNSRGAEDVKGCKSDSPATAAAKRRRRTAHRGKRSTERAQGDHLETDKQDREMPARMSQNSRISSVAKTNEKNKKLNDDRAAAKTGKIVGEPELTHIMKTSLEVQAKEEDDDEEESDDNTGKSGVGLGTSTTAKTSSTGEIKNEEGSDNKTAKTSKSEKSRPGLGQLQTAKDSSTAEIKNKDKSDNKAAKASKTEKSRVRPGTSQTVKVSSTAEIKNEEESDDNAAKSSTIGKSRAGQGKQTGKSSPTAPSKKEDEEFNDDDNTRDRAALISENSAVSQKMQYQTSQLAEALQAVRTAKAAKGRRLPQAVKASQDSRDVQDRALARLRRRLWLGLEPRSKLKAFIAADARRSEDDGGGDGGNDGGGGGSDAGDAANAGDAQAEPEMDAERRTSATSLSDSAMAIEEGKDAETLTEEISREIRRALVKPAAPGLVSQDKQVSDVVMSKKNVPAVGATPRLEDATGFHVSAEMAPGEENVAAAIITSAATPTPVPSSYVAPSVRSPSAVIDAKLSGARPSHVDMPKHAAAAAAVPVDAPAKTAIPSARPVHEPTNVDGTAPAAVIDGRRVSPAGAVVPSGRASPVVPSVHIVHGGAPPRNINEAVQVIPSANSVSVLVPARLGAPVRDRPVSFQAPEVVYMPAAANQSDAVPLEQATEDTDTGSESTQLGSVDADLVRATVQNVLGQGLKISPTPAGDQIAPESRPTCLTDDAQQCACTGRVQPQREDSVDNEVQKNARMQSSSEEDFSPRPGVYVLWGLSTKDGEEVVKPVAAMAPLTPAPVCEDSEDASMAPTDLEALPSSAPTPRSALALASRLPPVPAPGTAARTRAPSAACPVTKALASPPSYAPATEEALHTPSTGQRLLSIDVTLHSDDQDVESDSRSSKGSQSVSTSETGGGDGAFPAGEERDGDEFAISRVQQQRHHAAPKETDKVTKELTTNLEREEEGSSNSEMRKLSASRRSRARQPAVAVAVDSPYQHSSDGHAIGRRRISMRPMRPHRPKKKKPRTRPTRPVNADVDAEGMVVDSEAPVSPFLTGRCSSSSGPGCRSCDARRGRPQRATDGGDAGETELQEVAEKRDLQKELAGSLERQIVESVPHKETGEVAKKLTTDLEREEEGSSNGEMRKLVASGRSRVPLPAVAAAVDGTYQHSSDGHAIGRRRISMRPMRPHRPKKKKPGTRPPRPVNADVDAEGMVDGSEAPVTPFLTGWCSSCSGPGCRSCDAGRGRSQRATDGGDTEESEPQEVAEKRELQKELAGQLAHQIVESVLHKAEKDDKTQHQFVVSPAGAAEASAALETERREQKHKVAARQQSEEQVLREVMDVMDALAKRTGRDQSCTRLSPELRSFLLWLLEAGADETGASGSEDPLKPHAFVTNEGGKRPSSLVFFRNADEKARLLSSPRTDVPFDATPVSATTEPTDASSELPVKRNGIASKSPNLSIRDPTRLAELDAREKTLRRMLNDIQRGAPAGGYALGGAGDLGNATRQPLQYLSEAFTGAPPAMHPVRTGNSNWLDAAEAADVAWKSHRPLKKKRDHAVATAQVEDADAAAADDAVIDSQESPDRGGRGDADLPGGAARAGSTLDGAYEARAPLHARGDDPGEVDGARRIHPRRRRRHRRARTRQRRGGPQWPSEEYRRLEALAAKMHGARQRLQ